MKSLVPTYGRNATTHTVYNTTITNHKKLYNMTTFVIISAFVLTIATIATIVIKSGDKVHNTSGDVY